MCPLFTETTQVLTHFSLPPLSILSLPVMLSFYFSFSIGETTLSLVAGSGSDQVHLSIDSQQNTRDYVVSVWVCKVRA